MESPQPNPELDEKFKRILATAVAMLVLAAIGTAIACWVSYSVGYAIAFVAIVLGNICIFWCLLLRITGKHLK